MKPLAPVHERQGKKGGEWLSALEDLLPDRQADHDRTGDDDPAGRSSDPSATKRRPISGIYVETFVLGSVVPIVLLWFSAEAPWAPYVLPILYLAPLILGLCYGFAAGAACAVLTAVALILVSLLKPDAAFAVPRAQAIGLILVGMVAGQARQIWAARIRRLDSLARYHQTRLEQFTSAYHLLKVSHAQIEQRVAGGTRNLRNALEGLKHRAPQLNAQGGEPLGGIAEELLGIMVEQGDLYTASVYALNERSLLRFPALAKAGDAPEISVFNPLLRETMRTGMLTSVQAGGETGFEQVIAVVPLIDSSGDIHGVVVINDMPFLAVNADTFGLLGVLGKHIGDILRRLTHPIDEIESVSSLRDNLDRYLVDARQHGIPSAFLACRIFDDSRRELLVTHCETSGRGLDQSWIAKDGKGHPVIFMLLPLTDETGATTFARRLQQQVVGGQSAKSGMVNHLWMLDQYSHTDKMLAEVFQICHVEGFDAVHPVQHVGPSTEAAS
jgi:hypothetical protein